MADASAVILQASRLCQKYSQDRSLRAIARPPSHPLKPLGVIRSKRCPNQTRWYSPRSYGATFICALPDPRRWWLSCWSCAFGQRIRCLEVLAAPDRSTNPVFRDFVYRQEKIPKVLVTCVSLCLGIGWGASVIGMLRWRSAVSHGCLADLVHRRHCSPWGPWVRPLMPLCHAFSRQQPTWAAASDPPAARNLHWVSTAPCMHRPCKSVLLSALWPFQAADIAQAVEAPSNILHRPAPSTHCLCMQGTYIISHATLWQRMSEASPDALAGCRSQPARVQVAQGVRWQAGAPMLHCRVCAEQVTGAQHQLHQAAAVAPRSQLPPGGLPRLRAGEPRT